MRNFIDRDGLPKELLKELGSKSQYEKVMEIFKVGGTSLNVSEILVGYYRVHNEVKTRSFVTNLLYRCCHKKLIRPTGKKGEYIINDATVESKE